MAYRRPDVVPESSVPAERRGPVRGRFCRGCGGVYSRFAAQHSGKPVYGKDHVSTPCSHEGETFTGHADWWEPAVELLPAPAAESEAVAVESA